MLGAEVACAFHVGLRMRLASMRSLDSALGLLPEGVSRGLSRLRVYYQEPDTRKERFWTEPARGMAGSELLFQEWPIKSESVAWYCR